MDKISKQKNKFYQYELDILRVVGMLGIVFFHYTFRGYAADDMSVLHFPILGRFFQYGYLGIYLYLMISGYTIALSTQNKNFTNFVSSRIFRLYPSFWIAVCLTAIATMYWGGNRYQVDLKQFIVNLTMLSEFVGIPSVDGAYWFMYVILRFYFLVSLMLFFNVLKHQDLFAGSWLILSLLLVFFDIRYWGYFLIPEYSSFLISGILFYSTKKDAWSFYRVFLAISSYLFSIYILLEGVMEFNSYYSTTLSKPIVLIIITFIYLIMFLLSIKQSSIKVPRYYVILGAATYPLYLIHQNIGFMIFNRYAHYANKYIILMLTFLIMVSMSIVIVKYFDPFIRKAMVRITPNLIKQKIS
ncbi:MAG: acyltransferase [Desulfobacteraceae bacterium]|nr:acyltransferase [Desulfobacteraceae bacterium]